MALLIFFSLLALFPVAASQAGVGTVNLASVRQTIQGFGTSSAWQGAKSDKAMDALYGNANSNQVGLTILRLRIDPNKAWSEEISNAQKANARGAIVFASPWTPPASMKTNGNTVGGSLRTDQYGAYAAYLKSFVDAVAQKGVNLYAISMQNEPDITVTYESCDWTPDQVRNFVRDQGDKVGTKLIAAESFQFRQVMTDTTLNDPAAAPKVSIIAGHIYGGGLAKYALAQSKGKQVWMTEHYNDGADWNSMMTTAKEIHDCMTIAEYNAYVLWWMFGRVDLGNNQGNTGPLDQQDNPTDRAFVIGQFAKYVRPGYQRVDATYSPSGNVYLSAYTGEGKVVLVVVNTGGQVNQQFSISGGSVSSFTPHITSSSGKRISTEADVQVSGGSFSYTLQAQSITTFVGGGSSSGGSSGGGGGGAAPTTTTVIMAPPTTTTAPSWGGGSSGGGGSSAGGVSASLTTVSSWNGGAQYSLTLKNNGASAVCSVSVKIQGSVSSVWNLNGPSNGVYTTPGWMYIPPGGSNNNAGMVVSGSGSPPTVNVVNANNC